MPRPAFNRDLEALIQATEKNSLELKKTQQKVERLETAIQAMQSLRLKSERSREEAKSKSRG